MVVQTGTTLRTAAGKRLTIETQLGFGGQGTVYRVRDLDSGQLGAAKLFHRQYATADTLKRIKFLVGRRLNDRHPDLAAPIDVIDQSGLVGHLAPYIRGISLNEFLAAPNCSYQDILRTARNIASLVSQVHNCRIVWGDIQIANFLVQTTGSVFHLHAVDFDNFVHPGAPPQSMIGENLHLAPELRAALSSGQFASPTIEADLYSLSVLLHETILLKHPAAGADDTEATFVRAMSGTWLQDPTLVSSKTPVTGGLPVGVLSSDLCRKFRASFGADISQRPSAADWVNAVDRALAQIHQCPLCNCPNIIDSSKTGCPQCEVPYPVLTLLVMPTGRQIQLDRAVVALGRSELADSRSVSMHHAVVRRYGPGTWLESLGQNGTLRRNGQAWEKLPDGVPVKLQPHEHLRFGDVEVVVTP